jgi:predicted dienelactone hydrolase
VSPMEIVLVLGALALVLACWLPHAFRRPAVAAAGAVIASSTIVLIVVGMRWQMVPVLAGAAVASPFAVLRRRVRWWLALPGSVVCVALIAVGPAAAWALPVPVFPVPSGGFAVGTRVLQWTDPGRPETATPEPGDRRTVVVQLWYPARRSSAARARYLGRTEHEARTVAGGLASYVGVPGFVLDGLPRARTRSVVEAPVADGHFPVVIFSPGLGGVRTQNTAWAEELASHGYVIVGVDHPYDSAAVVLADGRTIHTRVTATGNAVKDEELAVGWTRVRAADLSFVLTRLERDAGPLAGRLDTGRVAAAGHSLGGAAALLAARQDGRFAAVIDLDGAPHDPAPRPFRQPVLAITEAIGPKTDPDYIPLLTRVLRLSAATSYRLTVPGAAHLTFTDAPLYLPPVAALVGSLGRTRSLRVTAAASMAFLDAALRGTGDPAPALATRGDLTVYQGR